MGSSSSLTVRSYLSKSKHIEHPTRLVFALYKYKTHMHLTMQDGDLVIIGGIVNLYCIHSVYTNKVPVTESRNVRL